MEILGITGYVYEIFVNGEKLADEAWRQNRNGRIEILEIQNSDGTYIFDLPIGEQFDIFFNVENEGDRVDCAPNGADENSCAEKGCRWSASQTAGVPWCFYDSKQRDYGYEVVGEKTSQEKLEKYFIHKLLPT